MPFVFTADGDIVDDPLFYNGKLSWPADDEHIRIGYTNEVQFIDRQMVQIFTTILSKSNTPPIVIIHGDHGLMGENRYEILNAYYLPGAGSKQLYPTISPVNSFRLIFDTYFGTQYGLVEDVSFSDKGEIVSEASPGCLP